MRNRRKAVVAFASSYYVGAIGEDGADRRAAGVFSSVCRRQKAGDPDREECRNVDGACAGRGEQEIANGVEVNGRGARQRDSRNGTIAACPEDEKWRAGSITITRPG